MTGPRGRASESRVLLVGPRGAGGPAALSDTRLPSSLGPGWGRLRSAQGTESLDPGTQGSPPERDGDGAASKCGVWGLGGCSGAEGDQWPCPLSAG